MAYSWQQFKWVYMLSSVYLLSRKRRQRLSIDDKTIVVNSLSFIFRWWGLFLSSLHFLSSWFTPNLPREQNETLPRICTNNKWMFSYIFECKQEGANSHSIATYSTPLPIFNFSMTELFEWRGSIIRGPSLSNVLSIFKNIMIVEYRNKVGYILNLDVKKYVYLSFKAVVLAMLICLTLSTSWNRKYDGVTNWMSYRGTFFNTYICQ